MYLIVGLGNPENEYAHTRHNMGFDAINEIAKKNNINITKTKFKALYETGIIHKKEGFCLVVSSFYLIFAVATKNDDYEVKGILYCTDFIACRRAKKELRS